MSASHDALASKMACSYPCENLAVFAVLRRGFSPFHPDPARDNRFCCREHLPEAVEETDAPDPGYVVHVTVLSMPGQEA